jgi:hypothetical protein
MDMFPCDMLHDAPVLFLSKQGCLESRRQSHAPMGSYVSPFGIPEEKEYLRYSAMEQEVAGFI